MRTHVLSPKGRLGRLLVLLPLVLAACVGRAGPPSTVVPGQAGADAWRQVPIGLCEDYPEETRSLAEVDRDLALVERAGAPVLRVSIGWDEVEPEDDRFDFAFWDQVVARAERRGVRLIPYVAYTPAWASGDGRGEDPDSWRRPPRDPAEFGEVMEQLARRYRGRIGSWELWNEPDNRDYWLGSVTDYARLLTQGAAGVRRGDPGARVVSGGLAGTVTFLAELVGKHQVGPAIDVVNVHAYYETWNGQPLETLSDYLDQVAAALAPIGPRPIWLAEVGYGTYRRGPEVSPYYRAIYRYEHTPTFAASALARTLALALAKPQVTLVAWYEVKDASPRAAVIGDVNNRHLGLATAAHQPKPALTTLSLFTRLFARGYRPLPHLPVYRRPDQVPVEVRAFELPDGAAVVLAWIPTRVPGRAEPVSAAGDAADARRTEIEVSLPCPAADRGLVRPGPQAVVLDERGRDLGPAPVGSKPGALSVGPLELRAERTTLAVVSGCARRPGELAVYGPLPR